MQYTFDLTGTSSFTDSADAGIDLGTLQSDGAVTVSGGATTIVNDSALALQGTVLVPWVRPQQQVESATVVHFRSQEPPVSPTVLMPESILAPCNLTEQLLYRWSDQYSK